jgi:predicted PurR-regulated permease PerM
MTKIQKVEISHKTIIFTVLFLIFLWFLYYIKDIILAFFVSLLVMAILNPTVTKLTKHKIPRVVSVVLIYFLVFGVFGLLVATLTPVVVDQTASFVSNLPKLVDNIPFLSGFGDQVVNQFITEVVSVPGQLAKVTLSVFSNLIGVFSVLVFSFYLILARSELEDQIGFFVGAERKERIGKVLNLLEVKLGGWARGELILMLVIGTVTYIGFRLIGLPYALPLAILAGFLEIVPTIGPTIAALPPLIIGFVVSPITGLATVALAFLVQQTENYLLVPRIMQSSVGLNPIITLLSLAIGFRLAGVIGAIISIPLVVAAKVILQDYYHLK